MSYKKEKIVLFGGSGFAGKNFAEQWREKYEVFVIDRSINFDFFQKIGVKAIQKNVLEESCTELLSEIEPQYIINFISIVDGTDNIDIITPMIEVDYGSLMQIYKSSKNLSSLKAVIQIGSLEEYGNTDSPFKEQQREAPISPYGIVKQLTTNISLMLYKNFGYPIMVIRPANLFGRYQVSPKFIPYLIETVQANQPLKLSGCEQYRDFIYIDKFVHKIDCLLQNYPKALGKIINIGSGESIQLKDIVNYTIQFFGYTNTVQFGVLPYRKNEIQNLSCQVELYQEITKTCESNSFWTDYQHYLESKQINN